MKAFLKHYISVFLLVFSVHATTQAREKNGFNQSLSTTLKISGDIQGEYELSGDLGSLIEAGSAKPDAVCRVAGLFREALYRSKKQIEVWLTLECTFEGQKNTYKPHRFYLDPDLTAQKIRLPVLAKNMKTVTLEFQNLSLSKSK